MRRTLVLAAIILIATVLGTATYATADTAIVYGSGGSTLTATDTVTVKATVISKLTMTVDTPAASQAVDFGNVTPGAAIPSQAVTMTVQSNRLYDISVAKVGDAPLGLSTTVGNSTNNARTAGTVWVDTYSLNVPWTTSPGNYTATVQYSVVQN